MKNLILVSILLLSFYKIASAQDSDYWIYLGQNGLDHAMYYGNDYSYQSGSITVWIYEKCNNDCGVMNGSSVYATSKFIRINKKTWNVSIIHCYLTSGQETTNVYDWDSNSYEIIKDSPIYEIKKILSK